MANKKTKRVGYSEPEEIRDKFKGKDTPKKKSVKGSKKKK